MNYLISQMYLPDKWDTVPISDLYEKIKNGVKSNRSYQRSQTDHQVEKTNRCRPFVSNQVGYSIILLYTDLHLLSSEIRDLFRLKNDYPSRMKGFNIIKIEDPREYQWLRSNEEGIVTTEFPTFLIAREGRPTLVIPKTKTKQMRKFILKLAGLVE